MSDTREDILARLLVVCAGVTGVVKAFRNQEDTSDKNLPRVDIWDADEAADDRDPSRAPQAKRRVVMTPEIYITVSDQATDVGTTINALRAALVKAVLLDATLLNLVGNDEGEIRYEGCDTQLARGRAMVGEMGVSISFRYILDANTL